MAQQQEITTGLPADSRPPAEEPPAVLRLAGVSLLHRIVKDWQTEFEPKRYPDWQPKQPSGQPLRSSGQGSRQAG